MAQADRGWRDDARLRHHQRWIQDERVESNVTVNDLWQRPSSSVSSLADLHDHSNTLVTPSLPAQTLHSLCSELLLQLTY
jgi:hypothetical protein